MTASRRQSTPTLSAYHVTVGDISLAKGEYHAITDGISLAKGEYPAAVIQIQ
ncbi:MAG: hypothetical protein IKA74_06405 [Clostridia bacterium]|nr:hypothetical protein [Clostridia bacterium]